MNFASPRTAREHFVQVRRPESRLSMLVSELDPKTEGESGDDLSVSGVDANATPRVIEGPVTGSSILDVMRVFTPRFGWRCRA